MNTHHSIRPKVGLLGGSFNPPHWGHLKLATSALTQLHLTRLELMPAGQPWQKSILINKQHRLAMCHLAVIELNKNYCQTHSSIACMPFSVQACEIQRNGATYTIDTLRYLTNLNPDQDYTLIIGSDQANQLDTWHNWQDLLQLCRLAIVNRTKQAIKLPYTVQYFFSNAIDCIDIIYMPPIPLSSTLIRHKITTNQAIDTDIPMTIAQYIKHYTLYK